MLSDERGRRETLNSSVPCWITSGTSKLDETWFWWCHVWFHCLLSRRQSPKGFSTMLHCTQDRIVTPCLSTLIECRRTCVQGGSKSGWTATEFARYVNFLVSPPVEICSCWYNVCCCREGKTELCVTPVINQAIPREFQLHFLWPFLPSTLDL